MEALLASRLGQGLALTVHRTVIHYQTPALRAARNELPFPGVNHYILLYRFYFLTTYGMYDPYNPLSSTVLLPNSPMIFGSRHPGFAGCSKEPELPFFQLSP